MSVAGLSAQIMHPSRNRVKCYFRSEKGGHSGRPPINFA